MNMIIMYLHVSDDQRNANAVILQRPPDGASDQQSHSGDHKWNHMWPDSRLPLATCDDGTLKIWKKNIYMSAIYMYVLVN